MWATIDEFFYNDVAGIKGPDYFEPTVTTPGYAEIRIAPFIPEHVHFVGATVRTVRGNVVVNWRREGTQQIRMDVTIPGNATADVSVPTLGNEQVVVRESDHVVWDTAGFTPGPAGIADGKADDGAITLRVGPGEYRFHLTAPEDK